jgi:hypothetical protein
MDPADMPLIRLAALLISAHGQEDRSPIFFRWASVPANLDELAADPVPAREDDRPTGD